MIKLLQRFKRILAKRYDGMLSRCYRKKDVSYNNYGKKGIKVCSEWIKDPESFRKWCAKELQMKGISMESFVENSRNIQLDRINGSLHYSPQNCTFSSAVENQRNKTNRKRRYIISAEGEKILL